MNYCHNCLNKAVIGRFGTDKTSENLTYMHLNHINICRQEKICTVSNFTRKFNIFIFLCFNFTRKSYIFFRK